MSLGQAFLKFWFLGFRVFLDPELPTLFGLLAMIPDRGPYKVGHLGLKD